jgi:uncharacterized protein (DUF1810 family)
MVGDYNLDRFLTAQEKTYSTALSEIKAERKQSHWMWYIFPQIKGLGFSDTSKFYAISSRSEAIQYMAHPVLGKRLIEISEALLHINGKSAREIFGSPDDVKLQSCMILFGSLANADPVFQAVLDKYFQGQKDDKTLLLVKKMSV